ncbi:MAG: Wzz/FepE/Etk N-terminal domain-containing protein [Verrucomicrobiota bacterium]
MNRSSRQSRPPDNDFRWLEIDLSDALYLVRRHFWVIALVPLCLAAVAFVVCKAKPPLFTSKATIYLRPNFDKEMLIERSFSKLEDDDSLRSVEKALIADTVILRMVDLLELRSDADFLGETVLTGEALTDDALLKKVRKRYQTKLLPNTRLIELEVRDFSSSRSKLIAETLIDEFLVHLAEERDLQESELRITLVTQSEEALEEALVSEKKLEQFRIDHPDLIVEQDSSVFQDRLLQYSQVLNQASSEVSSLEGMVAALKGIDSESDPYRIFQILKNRNSEYLSELLATHASAKTEFASVQQRFTEEHPSYREVRSRLNQIDENVRDYATEMKSGLESEFLAASRKEEKLRESLGELKTEFVSYKSKSAKFRGLKEEIDRSWNTYTQLQDKISNLDLNPENEFNFVTLISRPIAPDKKSHPKTTLWMGASGFLGLVLVGGWLLFRYREGLPFTSVSQLKKDPEIDRVSSMMIGTHGASSESSEMLNLAIGQGQAEVIHVSSPEEHPCSRSFVESLGSTLGRQNQKILWLQLRLTARPGENEFVPTPFQNLQRLELSAQRLVDPTGFKTGLEQCLARYDRVLIDSTELQQWESILASSSFADSLVVLVGKHKGSRVAYRQFFQQLNHAAKGPVMAIMLRSGRLIRSVERSRNEPPMQSSSVPVHTFTQLPSPSSFSGVPGATQTL